MTWTREDCLKNLAKTMPSQRTALLPLERAAVQAKMLTGAEHWDVYLSYLQAAIEREEKAADALRAALLSPHLVEADKIVRLKIDLAARDAAVRAWKGAIEIPAIVMRDGAAAKEQIDAMLEKAANG